MTLPSLSFRSLLRLLGAGLLAGLLGITLVGVSQVRSFNSSMENVLSTRFAALNEVRAVRDDLRSIQTSILTQASEGSIDRGLILQEANSLLRRVRRLNPGFRDHWSESGADDNIQALEFSARDWFGAIQAAFEASPVRGGAAGDRRLGQDLQAAQRLFGDPLQLHLDYLTEQQMVGVEQALEDEKRRLTRQEVLFIALLVVGAATLMGLFYWLTSSIRRSIGGDPEQVKAVTQAVVAGNLNQRIPTAPDDSQSIMANIRVMVEALRTNQSKSQHRLWLDRGLMLINDTVRNEYTPAELARELSQRLCDYLDVRSCAIYEFRFVAQGDSMIHREVLRLLEAYSRDREELPALLPLESKKFLDAAATGEVVRMKSLPPFEDTTLDPSRRVVTFSDSNYLLAPLLFEGRVRGVLALQSSYELTRQVDELLALGSIAIGVAIESAHNRETLVETLLDSQRLTNQLQENQERLKVSQETLKRQIDYANSIVTSMRSGLLVIDHRGLIKDCNPGVLKLTGLRRQQVLGQSPSLLFDENEQTVRLFIKNIRDHLVRLLQEDKANFREVFRSLPLGCIIVDPHGRITQANDRASQISGYAVADLVGQSVDTLVPVDSRRRHHEGFAEFRSEHERHRLGLGRSLPLLRSDGQESLIEIGLIAFEDGDQPSTLTMLREFTELPWSVVGNAALNRLIDEEDDSVVAMVKGRMGRSTPVRVTTTFIYNSQGAFEQAVVNIHDVSSLVRKSEEIRAQHALLERTMDAMQDGVLQIDGRGIVVSANPKALELLGRKRESTEGYSLSRLLEGGHPSASLSDWIPDQQSEAIQRLHDIDPVAFWDTLSLVAEPVMMLGADANISFANVIADHSLGYERGGLTGKPLQRLLEDSSLWAISGPIEKLFGGSLDEGIELDSLSWRRRDQSSYSAPLNLCGLNVEDKTFAVFCLGRSIHELKAELMLRVQNLEWSLAQTDGKPLPVALTVAPLRGVDGRITGAVITMKDMREFKAKESENLEMVRKMEQSQRLDALGQLAAGVAHDFNNLLGVVQNHAELVEMKVGEGHNSLKNVSAILQATSRARDIVIKLNGLGRDKPSEQVQESLPPFSLQPLLEETRSLLQASLKGIEITVETAPRAMSLELTGDSGGLQQVLVNLCVNASHAIGERRDGLIRMVADRQNNQAQIQVIDNGGGIPPEIMGRIFEPFFTTKEVGKGTGLGLAMVRSIITKMGGSIDCRSEAGVGTTFILLLPLAA